MYKLYYLEIISNYLIPTFTQYEQPCRRNGNHAPHSAKDCGGLNTQFSPIK
jgi:hypothetical protein